MNELISETKCALYLVQFSANKYSLFHLTDLNECSRDNYYCHQAATCTNYRGSFKCTCDKGYFVDGFDCASIVTGLYLNFLLSYNFRREKLKQLKLIYGRYQPHNPWIQVQIANAPSLGQVKRCCCCCRCFF